ncbi:glutathione peroxidase [Acrasis kona]|uniref:Glutathione peroxidase n=1 Tax=Acrasis kona TaxID=1008807 RepID=A0AAW2YXV7_9EUKA
MNISKFQVKAADGGNVSLSNYLGKVILVVNVASKCGFTPQYKDLSNLYSKYHDKGLEILAFPCNQFGKQEPGTNDEICKFAQTTYNTEFPIFAKVNVNGDDADPLFDFLKKEQPGLFGSKLIKWNFTKFLVNRQGRCVKRFGPMDNPKNFEREVANLL